MSEKKTTAEINQASQLLQQQKEQRLRNMPWGALKGNDLHQRLSYLNKDVNELQAAAERTTKIHRNMADRFLEIDIMMSMLVDILADNKLIDRVAFKAQHEDAIATAQNCRVIRGAEIIQAYDNLTVNFTGYNDDGTANPKMSGRNFKFDLNFQNLLPQLEAAFLGMTIGEKKTVEVEFPADYHATELSGKTYPFEIEVLFALRNLNVERQLEEHKKMQLEKEQAERATLTKELTDLGLETDTTKLSIAQLQEEVVKLKAQEKEAEEFITAEGIAPAPEAVQPSV